MPSTSPVATASYPANNSSVTVQYLLQRFLQEEGFGMVGTATGGDISTLQDTTLLKSGMYSADDFVGGWVRISTTTDDAAPVGEIRPISRYTPEKGEIEVSPRFSVAPQSGDKYQIFLHVHPQIVLDELDSVLTDGSKYPCTTFLTDLPDGDMESSSTSYWTGSNVSMAKTSIETATLPFYGKRYMAITLSSGTSGYIESKAMGVTPGMGLHVSSLVQTNDHASAQCKLSLWDKTNDVEIASYTVTRQLNVVRVALNNPTVPSTCYSVAVRLYNIQESGQTGPVNVDEVVFFPLGDKDIYLPSWVEGAEDVKAVFNFIPSGQISGPQVMSGAATGRKNNRWAPSVESFGFNRPLLVSRTDALVEPLYIIGARAEEARTTDETTVTNVDYLLAKLYEKAFSRIANYEHAGTYNIEFAAKKFDYWKAFARNESFKMYERIEAAVPDGGMSVPGNQYPGGGMANGGFRFARY